jgi:transcription antitermination factor NusG
MPILAKDVDLWPPNLLSTESPIDPSSDWYALYTKPRREKVLIRHLRAAGKSFCGLLVPQRSRVPSGRIVTSHLPLFPGYVFLNGSDTDRYDAVCTNCVSQVLDVPNGESLRNDLRQIHDAIQSGRSVTRVERIQKGQPVRIVAGPLAGQNGIYLHKKSKSRLVLSLSFIQQSAVIEIDDAVVEPT